MREFALDTAPEVFVSNAAIRRQVSRAYEQGRLRRLASRLYTRNLTDDPVAIVRRNVWPLVAAYFPGALIADRTAIEWRDVDSTRRELETCNAFVDSQEADRAGIRLRMPGV